MCSWTRLSKSHVHGSLFLKPQVFNVEQFRQSSSFPFCSSNFLVYFFSRRVSIIAVDFSVESYTQLCKLYGLFCSSHRPTYLPTVRNYLLNNCMFSIPRCGGAAEDVIHSGNAMECELVLELQMRWLIVLIRHRDYFHGIFQSVYIHPLFMHVRHWHGVTVQLTHDRCLVMITSALNADMFLETNWNLQWPSSVTCIIDA